MKRSPALSQLAYLGTTTTTTPTLVSHIHHTFNDSSGDLREFSSVTHEKAKLSLSRAYLTTPSLRSDTGQVRTLWTQLTVAADKNSALRNFGEEGIEEGTGDYDEYNMAGGSKKRKLDPAAQKYYAVKAGKQPGVYLTWAECQAQTAGFKGAVCTYFWHVLSIATLGVASLYIMTSSRPSAEPVD